MLSPVFQTCWRAHRLSSTATRGTGTTSSGNRIFYKSLDKVAIRKLLTADMEQLEKSVQKEASKTVFLNTKEELKGRLHPVGIMICKLLNLFEGLQSEPCN